MQGDGNKSNDKTGQMEIHLEYAYSNALNIWNE